MTTVGPDKVAAEAGNSDQLRRVRWCFTLFNYEDKIEWIKTKFILACKYLIFGEEECPDTKRKHLQGYFELKGKKNKKQIAKLIKGIWLFDAGGKRPEQEVYCSKDQNYFEYEEKKKITMKEQLINECLQEYNNVNWKPWQQALIEKIEEKPDNRSIYWIWEEKGNVGKSFLCKYLALKYDAIICEGKTNDILNQINLHIQNDKKPKVILIDSPRSHENYINYSCIEKVKNGLVYSGKYEGGVCAFPCPHVIIFANHEPDTEKMSNDRWKVVAI